MGGVRGSSKRRRPTLLITHNLYFHLILPKNPLEYSYKYPYFLQFTKLFNNIFFSNLD